MLTGVWHVEELTGKELFSWKEIKSENKAKVSRNIRRRNVINLKVEQPKFFSFYFGVWLAWYLESSDWNSRRRKETSFAIPFSHNDVTTILTHSHSNDPVAPSHSFLASCCVKLIGVSCTLSYSLCLFVCYIKTAPLLLIQLSSPLKFFFVWWDSKHFSFKFYINKQVNIMTKDNTKRNHVGRHHELTAAGNTSLVENLHQNTLTCTSEITSDGILMASRQ